MSTTDGGEPPPHLLPPGPMARLLGVKTTWLRAEAEAGRIPHLPAGDTILFEADLVARTLAERARRPLPVDIPDPDTVRARLAVVLTEADLLRAQLRVSLRARKERERLRRQGLEET